MATISIREIIPLSSDAISDIPISGAQATFLANTTTAGTAVADACAVLSASRALDYLDLTELRLGGVQVTTSAAEINYLTGTSVGSAVASKAPILDSGGDLQMGAAEINCGTAVITAGATISAPIDGTAIATSITASTTTVPRTDAIKSYVDTVAPKAYVKATGRTSTGNCTLANNYNSAISTVAWVSTGVYTVTLASPITDYVVQVTTVRASGAANARVSALTSTTQFTISVTRNNTAQEVDYLFITVFGA